MQVGIAGRGRSPFPSKASSVQRTHSTEHNKHKLDQNANQSKKFLKKNKILEKIETKNMNGTQNRKTERKTQKGSCWQSEKDVQRRGDDFRVRRAARGPRQSAPTTKTHTCAPRGGPRATDRRPPHAPPPPAGDAPRARAPPPRAACYVDYLINFVRCAPSPIS